MNYNARLTDIIQFILEPIQRQSNIIRSFTAWLSGLQYNANIFSERLIPETKYLANITSSKGAFEYYLNSEFNSASYSQYQPIFIGTLIQSGSNLYGYNTPLEVEYVPLYFLQSNNSQKFDSTNVFIYKTTQTYQPNELCYVVPTLNPYVQIFFQVSASASVSPGFPPFQNGLFLNGEKWQPAIYGFNNLQSTTGSEDVDFIVWVPKYLNPQWSNPSNSEFDIRIRAFVSKYKMAHTTFGISYY